MAGEVHFVIVIKFSMEVDPTEKTGFGSHGLIQEK